MAQSEDFVMVGDRSVSTRAYMAAFNLKGPMQEKRVGALSGGEKSRVHMAKVLKGRCVRAVWEPQHMGGKRAWSTD